MPIRGPAGDKCEAPPLWNPSKPTKSMHQHITDKKSRRKPAFGLVFNPSGKNRRCARGNGTFGYVVALSACFAAGIATHVVLNNCLRP